jgi:hypothetical protein
VYDEVKILEKILRRLLLLGSVNIIISNTAIRASKKMIFSSSLFFCGIHSHRITSYSTKIIFIKNLSADDISPVYVKEYRKTSTHITVIVLSITSLQRNINLTIYHHMFCSTITMKVKHMK